jgi:hypothetical protein
VERVARAMSPYLWEEGGPLTEENKEWMRPHAIQQARAAIEAMREPTDAMLEPFDSIEFGGSPQYAWNRAIDAALK